MTSNHHTPLPLDGTTTPEMTGELFNAPFGELDSAITNVLAGTQAFTLLKYADGGELTIASGAVTLTNAYHNIDTESDDASDDLNTINGLDVGKFAYVRANDTGRTVVLTHNVGNVLTVSGSSISLDNTTKIALLYHNGTNVIAMELGATAAVARIVATHTHTPGSSYTETSGTFTDVDATNVAVTATLNGGGVTTVTVNFNGFKDTAGTGDFRITDGTNNSDVVRVTSTAGRQNITMVFVLDGLASGSRTFKLQFLSDDANEIRVLNQNIFWSLVEIS